MGRMRTRVVALSLVGLILLAGCSAPAPQAPTAQPSAPAVERAEVDWEAYSGSTKRIIDEETAEKDCIALQDMFDVADTAGFLDQMKYIDEALTLAGCYE